MFKNSKNKLNEDRVREIIEEELDEALEDYVDEYRVEKIVNEAFEKRKNDFEVSWRLEHKTKEEAIRDINNKIDNIVYREIKNVVAEQSKIIEDKLLVELARQAMTLDNGKNK